MPRYHHAVYGGETVTLENRFVRLELHKRNTGWGWGELYVAPQGGAPDRLYAVIEHLGEADLEGLPHPMRLEAQAYELERKEDVQELRFAVAVDLGAVPRPDQAYSGDAPLSGTVVLTLADDEPVIRYRLEVQAQHLIRLKRLRGVWMRVGAESFGEARTDAIFPGIDWTVGDEWSSGTDWFEEHEALRMTPHPHKVAIPVMAVSYGGIGLGLAWTPDLAALSATTRFRCPQPVFAAPNFVERRPESLMGLMWPSARWGMDENALAADEPILIRRGLTLALEAEIAVSYGQSVDVVVDWIARHGMPEPGEPRYPWKEALERMAHAYNGPFWIEGEGWGDHRGKGAPVVPGFVKWYMQHGDDPALRAALKAKADWCAAQTHAPGEPSHTPLSHPNRLVAGNPQRAAELGDQILALQTEEGDFPFEPHGRHHTMLIDWAEFWRPLGQPGDSAIDLCATGAWGLLLAAKETGEQRFLDGARRALDYGLRWDNRPEGGDWWETPLHSPNLLTSGNAAIAYYLGYQALGDERYLQRAIHWIRCVLPFTHLWQPRDRIMLYNTKPCLNSTCWFLSDWVSKHVQWEVLRIFAESRELGIDWAELDPDVDWRTFQRGVTTASLRWMIDSQDPEWMFGSEYTPGLVEGGNWDTRFADTHDPIHGTYGGGPIAPDLIADNIRIVLGLD